MEARLKRTGRIIALVGAVFIATNLFLLLVAETTWASSNPLAGKRVLIEGDSIQCGFGKFAETAAKAMGAKQVKNRSKNGAIMALGRFRKNSTLWRVRRMSYAEIRKYNYIIITTGTNDYYRFYRVKPGTVNSTNVKTTGGALNYIIRRIQLASPETKIVIVTPIHRFSKRKSCEKIENRYGKTLADYRKVITDVASRYENVYVIKGTDISRAKEMKRQANSQDGLHPKKKYAKNILAKRFKALFVKTVINKPAVDDVGNN